MLNSFTQTKLIAAVVVIQTLLATFSAAFVVFALRNIVGALQLLGVGVVVVTVLVLGGRRGCDE